MHTIQSNKKSEESDAEEQKTSKVSAPLVILALLLKASTLKACLEAIFSNCKRGLGAARKITDG